MNPKGAIRGLWTDAEFDVVRALWPDISAIRSELPHRSALAVTNAAAACRLRKKLHIWTAAEDSKLRKMVRAQTPRREVAAALGLTVSQVQNRLKMTTVSYEKRAYTSVPDELTDAIRKRTFAMRITLVELDGACRSGQSFQHSSGSRPVAMKHAVKAIRILGGRLSVIWEPLQD